MIDFLGFPRHQRFMKKQKHTSLISQHITLKTASLKSFFCLLSGMLGARTINFALMAAGCGVTDIKADSIQKRFYRYLSKIVIPASQLTLLILRIIPLPQNCQIEILIDRTDWKRGSTAINFLVVALQCGKFALPLALLPIFEQDIGNSTAQQVQKILHCLTTAIGRVRQITVVGDREFGVFTKIDVYKKLGLAFVVRLKEEWHLAATSLDEEPVLMERFFKDLKVGQIRTLHNMFLGENKLVQCSLSFKRLSKDEVLVLAHSENVKHPLRTYKGRWRIETLFKDLKSNGFNIEATAVTDPQRLTSLLSIAFLAVAIIQSNGIRQSLENKPRRKKHGYAAKSIFRLGLEFIIRNIDFFRINLAKWLLNGPKYDFVR